MRDPQFVTKLPLGKSASVEMGTEVQTAAQPKTVKGKKTYEVPTLIKLGTVKQLTQGINLGPNDNIITSVI